MKDLFLYPIKITKITFLFGKEYNDEVILSGRHNGKTVYLRIMHIDYFIYIAKIPGMTEEEFEYFLYNNLSTEFMYEKVYMCDSTVSTLTQKYCFYKIYGAKRSLQNLVYMKKQDSDKPKEGYGVTCFYKNTYLTPALPQEITGYYQISLFYKQYLNLIGKINPDNLKGIDYLIYPYILYPFRNTKQDLSTIQNAYNINFFDTIEIPEEFKPIVCNKYACDEIYYVPIKKLKNVSSTLTQDINDYWQLMFDIENAVYIKEQHDNKEPITKLLDDNFASPYHSDNYFKFVSQFRKTRDGQQGFYDYNQIICVSCIEQSFSGNYGKKIALVNCNGDKDKFPQDVKDKINNDFSHDQVYADEVILCNSERELLLHLIDILANPKYHVISHFNGWGFDERMIMSRMCLYDNLFEYYYQRMKTIKTTLPDSDKYNISYEGSYKNGTSMCADKKDLCQIKDGLRMSFDVYQICLHDSVDSQKHDDNSLNGLLEFYGLGLKGDITYQQLTDAFYNKDIPLFIKGVWYCQRDSIQQCVLQHHLKQILSYIQFCTVCHIPLQTSVQNAVGAKVQSIIAYFTMLQDLPLLDVVPPYTVSQEDLTNVGGEVICFKPGFDKYVSAVDASSMYPAQVEANNISNDCMLYPDELIYILTHLDEFGYKQEDISVTILHDMYSPMNNSWQKISLIDYLWQQGGRKTSNRIYYIQNQGEQPLKYYRYEVHIGDLTYQQFFFQKKNMSPTYNYVFYLQNKQGQKTPYSPFARMLTTLRFRRKDVKKQMKQAKDEMEHAVLNTLQDSIKKVMNSTYGQLDVDCYFTRSEIGPSAITYQSRCIIQNCRDHLTHQFHRILPEVKEKMTSTIEAYHSFIYKTFKDPTAISIRFPQEGILQIPQLVMKYQDTDSNYFLMPCLDILDVKDKYKDQFFYVKTQTFGLFNDVFRAFINSCMNKFPLEFGFEGAFYRSWHIQAKMYLGQKAEQFVCKLDENDNIIPTYHLTDNIDLTAFNPEEDDVDKFIKSNHIKVTGLQVIKRNTPILLKRYYIKLIQQVLNQTQQNLQSYLIQLLKEFKEEFKTLPQKQFFKQKKVNEKDMAKPYIIYYNTYHKDQPLGLGAVMSTVVIRPGDVSDDQFHKQSFKVEPQTIIIPPSEANNVNLNIYMGYYIYSMAKNLLTFIEPNEDTTLTAAQKTAIIEKKTKALLEQSNVIRLGHNKADYKINTKQDLDNFIALYQFWKNNYKKYGMMEFFDNNIRWNVMNLEMTLRKFLQENNLSYHPMARNYCRIIMDLLM